MTNAPLGLLRRALDFRAIQQLEQACEAIAAAQAMAPADPGIALTGARLHFEAWRDATALFDRARALAPDDLRATAGMAAALDAQGQHDAAARLLGTTLEQQPGWIAGHRQLSALRVTAGRKEGFDRSFAKACRAEPANLPLRLAWFQTLASARDWPAARRVVADGVALIGGQRGFDLAIAFLASESDEASRDPHLFDSVADARDIGLDLCRVRFWLRNQRPDRAASIAACHIDGTAARTFWPYLSLASRLLDDRQSFSLDQDPQEIVAVDLGLSSDDLERLATALRRLLRTRAPQLEQSVRGGVQTDRNLFFNPDPAIQAIRHKASSAVRSYLDALPAPVPRHPLLGPARDRILYEGSWSVLLDRAGHHAPHTHSRGWISSALHVETPDSAEGCDPHAGWIAFGTPPTELALNLPPIGLFEPQPGRLILFPSTTWHRTVPFAAGQRLTIAFDVAIPVTPGAARS